MEVTWTDCDLPCTCCLAPGDVDLFSRGLCSEDIVRSCEEGLLPASAMAVTGTPPSEVDLPVSAIHSPPSLECTSLLGVLTPASRGEGGTKAGSTVEEEEEDGSATFLKVRVQVNSSPEKKAVSGKDGKTLIVDAELALILGRFL